MAAPSITGLQRAFYSISLVIIVVAVLYYAQVILVPLALSILLAFVLSPPVNWLEAHGLPRIVSVLLVAVVAFVFLGLTFWVVSVEVSNLARQWPEHQADVGRKLEGIQASMERVQKLATFGRPQTGEGKQQPSTTAPPDTSSFVSWIPSIAQPLLDILARTLLVIVLTVFIMVRHENLRDRLLYLVGQGNLTNATKTLGEAARRVSRYLLNQLGTNSLIGLGVAVGLYWLGVPYALLWGLLTIALRFIPYVGVWVAALFPFAVSVAFFPGWSQALAVLGIYLFLELVTANVIEPLWFGHSTGVSPIALLVAAVFWAWLWGPLGLLVSTPLTVCLVVLGKRIPYLEMFDVLLGEPPPLDPATRYYQRLVAKDAEDATSMIQEYAQTHSLDAVYDDVLIAALIRAKRDRNRDNLTPADARLVFQVTRHILDEALVVRGHSRAAQHPSEPTSPTLLEPNVEIIATPAQGEADDAALHLLQYLLRPDCCELRIISAKRLRARLDVLVEQLHASTVCIAALPPGGVAQASHLCRELRARQPQLKILVGRWGQKEDAERARQALLAAGADFVATTLLETRDQILALIRGASSAQPGSTASPSTGGTAATPQLTQHAPTG